VNRSVDIFILNNAIILMFHRGANILAYLIPSHVEQLAGYMSVVRAVSIQVVGITGIYCKEDQPVLL